MPRCLDAGSSLVALLLLAELAQLLGLADARVRRNEVLLISDIPLVDGLLGERQEGAVAVGQRLAGRSPPCQLFVDLRRKLGLERLGRLQQSRER